MKVSFHDELVEQASKTDDDDDDDEVINHVIHFPLWVSSKLETHHDSYSRYFFHFRITKNQFHHMYRIRMHLGFLRKLLQDKYVEVFKIK